jgi:hypothetical protein
MGSYSYWLSALSFTWPSLALYRLLLSPIAGFPGPKLAALTQWYEFYYNVIQLGQFYLQIERLHDKYGECCYGSISGISESTLESIANRTTQDQSSV